MEEVGGRALGATFLTMDCALPMLITCYSAKVELVSFSLNFDLFNKTFSKDLQQGPPARTFVYPNLKLVPFHKKQST